MSPPNPSTVKTEFDIIKGNVTNPYPTTGYTNDRAFVSAEGAGYDAWSSNRGSSKTADVVFVTSLADDPDTEGTLAYALQTATGARKVWPLVWGYVDATESIHVTSGCYYTNVFRPGTSKGLCLRNGVTTSGNGAAGGVVVDSGVTDIVFRFFRSHAGATDEQVAGLLGANGVDWSTNGMNNFIANSNTERIILDHCNFAFCADQNVGSVGTDGFTIQHSWMQAPIDTHFHTKWFTSSVEHAMPVLFGYSCGDVTMHHTLISTGRERNPRISDMNTGSVFHGTCNYVYNPRKWGPFFLHDNRNSGDRPHVNWSKAYWEPGPWTVPTSWLRLGSASDLPGYPQVWLNRITAPGFLTDSENPWSSGIEYGKGGSGDYIKTTAHDALPVLEEANSVDAREAILATGADRYVIDPATGDLKDTRDAVVKQTYQDCTNGTGLNRGFDVADVQDPIYGYDTDFPSGSISKADFFTNYYNPWATAQGFATGEVGFNAWNSTYSMYNHDLYEASLTPHYPAISNDGGDIVIPEPPSDDFIPNPFEDGVHAYPFRGFWAGSGSSPYWTDDTTAFLTSLANNGYNACPSIPGTLDAHYSTPNRIQSYKNQIAFEVSLGMIPTTDPASQNQARWRDNYKWAEAFTIFDVPFKASSGKLVPRNVGTYDVDLGDIENWTEASGGDVAWSGNTVEVTNSGDTSNSRTITKTVSPGLYMLVADITVLSGAPDCQLYFTVDGGLAIAGFTSGTGEIAMPVLVGAECDTLKIFARLRTSAAGKARYNSVTLTPMHHELRNVQVDMGGVRVKDSNGNTVNRTVTISGENVPGDPRDGSTCVINVDLPNNTEVTVSYESMTSPDKVHLLNHPDAFAWWKANELETTAVAFADNPPVWAHIQAPSETRGYNRDARSSSYGKNNDEWLYDYVKNHVDAVRAVWPNIYVAFWDDMFSTDKNGRSGYQTGYGGRPESVSGVLTRLKAIPGLALVIWDYGTSVENASMGLAVDLTNLGIPFVAGPGQIVGSIEAWLSFANGPASFGGLVAGMQYMEYHERIGGYKDMSKAEAVRLS